MLPSRSVAFGFLAGALLAAAPAAASLLNVRDYATPQAAIDAAHDGDRVYFPAGIYLIPDSGLVVEKHLELFGDGIGRGETGTILKPSSVTGDGNVIVLRSHGAEPIGYVTIRDLRIANNGPPGTPGAGRGYGILLRQGARSPGVVDRVIVERVVIAAMAADGICIEGGDQYAVILSSLTDVEVIGCRGNGLVLANGAVISVVRGYFIGNRLAGIFATAVASLRLDQVSLERNQDRPAVDDPKYDTQLRIKLCHGFNALGCYFENFAVAAPRGRTTAIVIEGCRGGVLQGCYFTQASYLPASRGVLATGGASTITFGANSYDRVGTTIQIDDSAEAQSHVVFPQCAIRAVPTDTSAYSLRVGSRTAGNVLLLPRASATDSTQRYFDGLRWRNAVPGR
ncbi:MAG TPA: hypothetical protein VI504_16340 [Candidatus Eisenbacteria bacterium]|jgi:hypothetical protein